MQWGQPLVGTEVGPDVIRAHGEGLRSAVTSLGWRYHDRGDLSMGAKDILARAPEGSGIKNAEEGVVRAVKVSCGGMVVYCSVVVVV